MIYGTNGIKPQWKRHYGTNRIEYTPQFIAPIEKAWFYERLFIEVVMVKYKNVMVKDTV